MNFICKECGSKGKWYHYSGKVAGLVCPSCFDKISQCKKCNVPEKEKFYWDEEFKDAICLDCLHESNKILSDVSLR